MLTSPFLNEERRRHIDRLGENLLAHDLKKGIPFGDNSVDAVYHSHVLEHIDRIDVAIFQSEVLRVLKPGGIQRICVPDLEFLAGEYMNSLARCDEIDNQSDRHDQFIEDLLEQSVRREAWGTSQQPPLRRWIENAVLGDARRRGETHQWMYDRVSLRAMLRNMGFSDVSQMQFNESNIPDWSTLNLELDENNKEYKPGSLYIEAAKP